MNDASDTARGWLDAPRPPPGASGVYARNWFAHWMRILLLDLAVFDGVVITREGAAEILGTDTAMIAAVLDRLRRDDDEEPKLTARDFARVGKAH